MICGVHGSPAYKLTEPILSKRKPAGTALICAAGFFIWAQPAIPVSTAPATTKLDKIFFIPKKSDGSHMFLVIDIRTANVDSNMNILLKSLPAVEAHFGKKATMASNLLDMVAEGEKAHGFLTGTMDNGWDVTVGLFNDKVRYVRFKKRTATKWTEADMRTVLMQIGPYSNWSRSPADSDYFDYAEKQGDNLIASATGWQTPARTRVFIYIPVVSGEIGIMPDKNAVDQKA